MDIWHSKIICHAALSTFQMAICRGIPGRLQCDTEKSPSVDRRAIRKSVGNVTADRQDPATPLRNARRLASEMGDNARLSKHKGFPELVQADIQSRSSWLRSQFRQRPVGLYSGESPRLHAEWHVARESGGELLCRFKALRC